MAYILEYWLSLKVLYCKMRFICVSPPCVYTFGKWLDHLRSLIFTIIQLDNTVIEAYCNEFGWAPTAGVLAHLKWELVHAIYRLVLGNEHFQEAYRSGIDLECADTVVRRFILQYFSHSCDYVEKWVRLVHTSQLITFHMIKNCERPLLMSTKATIISKT